MSPVKAIPENFHSVTPTLTVRNAAQAIEFYKKALGATERGRMESPDGTIAHAEIRIGDSIIFLGDENPNMGNQSPQSLGGSTGGLFVYVEDVDSAFQRAIDAGGKVSMPVSDMFWGDRYGRFTDPFGHTWALGTHKEDLSPQEMEKRSKEFFAQTARQMSQKKTA